MSHVVLFIVGLSRLKFCCLRKLAATYAAVSLASLTTQVGCSTYRPFQTQRQQACFKRVNLARQSVPEAELLQKWHTLESANHMACPPTMVSLFGFPNNPTPAKPNATPLWFNIGNIRLGTATAKIRFKLVSWPFILRRRRPAPVAAGM